jgi:hypothetical protein
MTVLRRGIATRGRTPLQSRQKAKGKRQKAKVREEGLPRTFAFCPLPFAFCLDRREDD